MKFVDEINLIVKAGKGGNGCISFKKEKNTFKKKSDGGNGGNGGNIYIVLKKNLNTLIDYRYKKIFCSKDGKNGKNKNKNGKNGKDLYLYVPKGTFVINIKTNESLGNTIKKKKILIAKGGKGGYGNIKFKNLLNKNIGNFGEKRLIKLKLMLLANVGMLGTPNVGKSTFTKCISFSKTKISNYPFTTLIPYLSIVYINKKKFTVADIPGIIKGASKGIGLGIKFLKHIEKCKIILHLIDITCDIKNIIKDIKNIIKEIKIYNKNILNKLFFLILNKIDLISYKEIIKKIKIIKLNYINYKKIYLISALKNIGIRKVCIEILKYL